MPVSCAGGCRHGALSDDVRSPQHEPDELEARLRALERASGVNQKLCSTGGCRRRRTGAPGRAAVRWWSGTSSRSPWRVPGGPGAQLRPHSNSPRLFARAHIGAGRDGWWFWGPLLRPAGSSGPASSGGTGSATLGRDIRRAQGVVSSVWKKEAAQIGVRASGSKPHTGMEILQFYPRIASPPCFPAGCEAGIGRPRYDRLGPDT